MPRKKLPVKRDESVRVNLLPAEKEHLEARARELDVSLSHYLRLLVKADMISHDAAKSAPKSDAK